VKNKQNTKNGNWFNQVILDVLVTCLVVISTFWMPPLLRYLLYGYSGLLLLMRVVTLFNNGLGTPVIKKARQQVPDWFYHVNYFICTAILFITMEYVLGGMWAAIWLLSWISTLKSSRTATSAGKG